MPITPDDLLDLAENIITANSSKEVNYRNSAGRSYYAIFHYCKKLAESKNLKDIILDPKLGSHERIIMKLKLSGHAQFISLGNLMKEGKERRKFADYKIWLKYNKAYAEELLELAKRVKAISGNITETPSPQ